MKSSDRGAAAFRSGMGVRVIQTDADKQAAWEVVISQYDLQLAKLDPVEDGAQFDNVTFDKAAVQAKIDAL